MDFGIKDKEDADFEFFMQRQKFPHICLGSITSGEVMIDNEHFGQIEHWKRIHDNLLAEKMEA